jgi:plastocyanin
MGISVRRSLPALFLLGLGLATLSCSSNSTGPSGATVVNVNDDSFSPAAQNVAVGATVEWDWMASHGHNVTWVTNSGTGNSATQASGTYSRTFSAPGTYDYYCTIHGTPTSGMHGTVVVQ